MKGRVPAARWVAGPPLPPPSPSVRCPLTTVDGGQDGPLFVKVTLCRARPSGDKAPIAYLGARHWGRSPNLTVPRLSPL